MDIVEWVATNGQEISSAPNFQSSQVRAAQRFGGAHCGTFEGLMGIKANLVNKHGDVIGKILEWCQGNTGITA